MSQTSEAESAGLELVPVSGTCTIHTAGPVRY